MPRAVRLSFFAISVFVAACGNTPSLEPVYEGCATDENWITFDDYEKTGRVTTSGSALPQWNTPAADGAVPATSAAVFQWQPSAGNAGMPDGNVSCPQGAPDTYRPGTLQISHLPAVSGTIYDLHFSVDGADAYRVLTTRQSTGVPLNIMSRWTGKSVTATLYEAKMLSNDIVEGPYQAAPRPFKVTP